VSTDAKQGKKAGKTLRLSVAFRKDAQNPPAAVFVSACSERHILEFLYEYFNPLVFYDSYRQECNIKNIIFYAVYAASIFNSL
jgi:hypothetical protein